MFGGNIGGKIYEVEPQGWGHDYLGSFSVSSSAGLSKVSQAMGTLGLETRPEDLPEGVVFVVYHGASTPRRSWADIDFTGVFHAD